MIAKLPELVRDLTDAWPLVLGAVGLVSWISRRQRAWAKRTISDPIDELRTRQANIATEVSQTAHLVAHHLGPNGDNERMCLRVARIEKAAGIEAPAPKEWP